MIDKIVELDMRRRGEKEWWVGVLYEQNLMHCEIMDAILKGEDYAVGSEIGEWVDPHTAVSVHIQCDCGVWRSV